MLPVTRFPGAPNSAVHLEARPKGQLPHTVPPADPHQGLYARQHIPAHTHSELGHSENVRQVLKKIGRESGLQQYVPVGMLGMPSLVQYVASKFPVSKAHNDRQKRSFQIQQ